jgi:hypothetical protein
MRGVVVKKKPIYPKGKSIKYKKTFITNNNDMKKVNKGSMMAVALMTKGGGPAKTRKTLGSVLSGKMGQALNKMTGDKNSMSRVKNAAFAIKAVAKNPMSKDARGYAKSRLSDLVASKAKLAKKYAGKG